MDATMMTRLAAGFASILVAFAAPAIAQDTAGEVLFATGQVSALRAPPVALAKGDNVLVSDTVQTGAASRAQLLMIDGARIAIRPESQLRIDEYRYPSGSSPSAPVAAASGDRSVTTLLKGGFRTITGAIGKDNENAYEVRTAVGVLGIRGTDYTAVFCNADCLLAPGATSTPPEDGLYLGVAEGIIVFRNAVATIELRAGEYAFIPLTTRRPERLAVPPPVLIEEPENTAGANRGTPVAGFDSKLGSRRQPDVDDTAAPGGPDGGQPGASEAPEQPLTGTDADGTPIDLTPGQAPPNNPPPPGNRTVSWASGPLFGAQGFAFSASADNTPTEYVTDANGDLVGFNAPYPTQRQGGETAVFDVGTAAVAEAGTDQLTVLRWGRWAGGTAGITLTSGGAVDQDLSNQSLHWVIGPDQAGTPPAMPVTGVANYTLLGGTAPTDNFGGTGILAAAAFSADFTNQQVTSSLTIDFAQQQWIASGTGQLGSLLNPVQPDYLFGGTYNNVSVNGIGGGTGSFSGFFSEPGTTSDPSFPGGAGLTYTLQEPNGLTTVSGAAAFGNP